MIELSAIEALASQYSKFGWKLRRILGTDLCESVFSVFPDISVHSTGLDALWFSRSANKSEAWELRRLIGPPFALVRIIPANASDSEREGILSDAELQMKTKPESSHDEIVVEK